MRRPFIHLIVWLACGHGAPVLGVETASADSAGLHAGDDLSQVRQIRARKLVRKYYGREMTMVLSSGELKVGRLRTLHQHRFILFNTDSGGHATRSLLPKWTASSCVRAPTEVLLSGITALGVGALAAGVLALTGSVDAAGVVMVGGLGAAIGGSLGWRTFHRDTIISLE